jgi:hypothetical protein
MSIIEMCNSIHLDSKHRIIGLYKVVFQVFRFKTTFGKINGLEKFVKNIFINVYNNNDNLCIFACLAYHLNTEEYLKTKRDVRCIHKIAERIANKFYGKDFDNTQYRGFDIVSEIQDLCNTFNVNIAYYSYKEKKLI